MKTRQRQDIVTNRAETGFTLLEVLVALSILGIALTVILQIFSADLRNIKKAADTDEAAVKAAARMRAIAEYETPTGPITWTETTADGYTMIIAVDDYLQDRTENVPFKMLQIELTIQQPRDAGGKPLKLRTIKTVDKS